MNAAAAHGVAAHIEVRLGVQCKVGHDGLSFVIDWLGERDADVDFLRPWVLPPR